jgi:hypothetical protein
VGETKDEKQASLARLMHTLRSDMLKKCALIDFGDENSTLVILTGIQINMPRPFDDFLPIEFYITNKDGTKENVFAKAFASSMSRAVIARSRPPMPPKEEADC